MAEMTAVVHTHTHTHTQCNLKKEKLNALLYAFSNNVNINVGAERIGTRPIRTMPAHADKYKIDEFLI